MPPLIFILPFLIVYLVVRALMHKRAGRARWCIQYLFIAGFFVCILGFEIWMQSRP